MRRTSLVLSAALMLAGTSLRAQTGTPATPKHANPVTRVVRLSLRGIVLTDAEKASLATLSSNYNPKFKALGESAAPLRAALKAARAKQDTAAAHAARRSLQALKKTEMTTLRSTLVDIRAVLTPEHQATFDANAARVRRALKAGRGR